MTNALTNAQREKKKLMPSLHRSCGFDFCKPYAVEEFDGKFTENKIRRMMAQTVLEGEAVTPTTHRIIVLTKGGNRIIDNWYLVEILNESVNISIMSNYSYRDSFDHFYAKSRYNEFRKSDDCHTIVVAQHHKYCKIPKTKPLDLSERINVTRFNYCYSYPSSEKYISSLYIYDSHERETVCHYVHTVRTLDANEIIDKSGYLLDTRRAELKRRVIQRKEEMEKAIVDRADFSEHVITLTNLVAYKKSILTERFKNCNTYADYRDFERDFSFFDGFINTVGDFERYCECVNNKGFKNLESESRMYNSLIAKLTK